MDVIIKNVEYSQSQDRLTMTLDGDPDALQCIEDFATSGDGDLPINVSRQPSLNSQVFQVTLDQVSKHPKLKTTRRDGEFSTPVKKAIANITDSFSDAALSYGRRGKDTIDLKYPMLQLTGRLVPDGQEWYPEFTIAPVASPYSNDSINEILIDLLGSGLETHIDYDKGSGWEPDYPSIDLEPGQLPSSQQIKVVFSNKSEQTASQHQLRAWLDEQLEDVSGHLGISQPSASVNIP